MLIFLKIKLKTNIPKQILLLHFVSVVQAPVGSNQDYEIGICCFSVKHTALRRKNKDWLGRNQDNVSEWGDMFIRRLLFQCASFNMLIFLKIKLKTNIPKQILLLHFVSVCDCCLMPTVRRYRHVAPLGHIILIPTQPVFALSP
jgi:hypothetical protein